jgi:RHH-type transcriptional regulator, rel operon repressor / antitoxin RelB
MSSATTTLTIEVPSGIEERLEQLARATSRTKDWLAREALRSFVDLYDWQVQAIRRGIEDADAGRFVDHENVVGWLETWGRDNEQPPPKCD